MNWLIYIGGWYFGIAGITAITELVKIFGVIKGITVKVYPAYTHVAWTMV